MDLRLEELPAHLVPPSRPEIPVQALVKRRI
jgi:hypothetical protein